MRFKRKGHYKGKVETGWTNHFTTTSQSLWRESEVSSGDLNRVKNWVTDSRHLNWKNLLVYVFSFRNSLLLLRQATYRFLLLLSFDPCGT